jgi:HD superfamily phosphohydrolase YqeK
MGLPWRIVKPAMPPCQSRPNVSRSLHPIVAEAAHGRLPHWSRPSPHRYAHMQRVAALLGDWAASLDLPDDERSRWRAAGFLHDALREVPPDELRSLVPARMQDLPGKLLHGPAAAVRLRAEGIDDEPLLRALEAHTIGHPDLDDLGRALFIADYIEPGRQYEQDQLAVLRGRMPHARDAVLLDVLRARIGRLLTDARPIRDETAAFWNRVTAQARG